MSEVAPLYIACASGNNSFTDCLVMRRGDLIRLIGHAQMDFTLDDARRLIAQIQTLLEGTDREIEEAPPLVQAVLDRFQTMFPEGTDWTRLDIEYLVISARGLLLTLAQAIETLRKEQLRQISDGR